MPYLTRAIDARYGAARLLLGSARLRRVPIGSCGAPLLQRLVVEEGLDAFEGLLWRVGEDLVADSR